MNWSPQVVLGALALLAAGACGPTRPATLAAASTPRPAVVYAALGAGETAGVGTDDPSRQAFPLLLYRQLPRSAVLYDFGLPGETTAGALSDELSQALAVRPTLVTVWFGADDLLAGVSAATYEGHLDRIVSALRRHGAATVLVTTGLPLDRLPAYSACRPDPPADAPDCPAGSGSLPPPDQMRAQVAAYAAAAGRVAARQGAIFVDLSGQGTAVDRHPEYVSFDGLHPSAQGAAAAAAAFAAALPASMAGAS